MTIPFKAIPSNLRVPLFYAELDASHANTSAAAQRTLLLGQMTSSGTATANQPVQAMSVAAVSQLAGNGSILAGMMAAYRANDPTGEVWILPLADDGAGTAATGSIAFSGTTTAAGTLFLYIAGQFLPISIASGQTAAQVATTVTAAINAAVDLPVTAATATATVNITCKHKGAVGNDVDIRLNYRGTAAGETVPAGLTATITAMASGATNPAIATALTNLQDMSFDFIVSSLTDSTTTAAIKNFLNDTSGRWSWQQQVYGHAFYALRATSGSAASWSTALNDQHATVMPYQDSPSPSWWWAAGVAGAAAVSLRADPGLPLQTLTVQGVLAPPIASRFGLSIRNTLLYSGSSTFVVDANGTVTLENVITTYVTNAQGQPDNSYLEIETMFVLMYVLRFMASMVRTKYSRVKLAADGTRLLPGSNVVTPAVIKADIIAAYRELEEQGMVQLSTVFAQNLVVEKDAQNPNRVNVLWPAVLINQLRTFALLAQFRLN